MGRPPSLPAPEKQRHILSILAGEITVAAAVRQAKVSDRFDAHIAPDPASAHVRTPGRNGNRERAFGTLRYECLYRKPIDTAIDLAEAYRIEDNTVRPREAISWNRPHDVHTGPADPALPTFDQPGFLLAA